MTLPAELFKTEPNRTSVKQRTSVVHRGATRGRLALLNFDESKKLEAALARFQDLVFSLAESLLGDETLATETTEEVFKTLTDSSEVFANAAVDSPEFEREMHRLTYDLALPRMLTKHRKPITQ